MAKSRLHELTEHGQSIWFDTLSRELVALFLGASFVGEGRYLERLAKVRAMEEEDWHGHVPAA